MAFENDTVDSHSWVAHTAPDIKDIGAAEGSVAVVPVGSVEQHGDHLPVGTDTILADAAAHAGAEQADDDIPVIITPPIWTGLSPHHLEFGGTITLTVETMLSVLRDVAASILDNGFDAVFFLNGHGGNMALLSTAVTQIGHEFPDTQILGLTYFQLAGPVVEEYRESELGGMAHGGEFETSLMLHFRPDLVEDDQMEAEYMNDPYDLRRKDLFEGGPLSVYRPFSAYSDSGAIGDPELGSAEKGLAVLDHLAEELAILLRAIHEQNRS